ncbi:hypothetical protein KBC03_05695 [Patescibacteria group bacterium]|nr:hypothetical protein [Patescibacteria group bacterium]
MFLVCTLSLIIRPKWYKKVVSDMVEHPAIMFITALINLVGGAAIVLHHNIRTWDWTVAITLIGWLAIVKGAIRILFPQFVATFSNRAGKKSVVYSSGVVCAILTLILYMIVR